MDNFVKIEDIVGDVVYLNLEDISFIATDLDKVIVRFKGNPHEHTFDSITDECLEELKKFPRPGDYSARRKKKKQLNEEI